MDDITASIIVACQTDGAAAAIDKLGFSFAMLAREALSFGQKAVAEFRVTQDAAWKFGKTFKDSMGSAENAVREFMEEYNLAESTSRSMLTDTAQILKGMGFAERESLNVAASISRWGVDLASFTGYAGGAQGAVQAIIASMMGENERLKSLGVVIREDSDEFRDMTKEIMKTKNVSEQHAKALAKLELITRKAADAKGDYAAEGENFTQSVNNLNQQIKQMTSNVGEVIYEGLRLNDAFGWVGETLKDLSKKWRIEKETWLYLIRDFTLTLATNAKIAFIPFKTLFEGIGAGFSNIVTIGQWFNDNWGKIWANSLDIVKAVFLDIWEYIKWFWGPDGMITGFLVKADKAFSDAIKTALNGGDVAQVFKDAFSSYIDKNVVAGFAKQGKNLEQALTKAGVSAKPELKAPKYNWKEQYNAILDEAHRQEQLELARYEKRLKKAKDRNASPKESTAESTAESLGESLKESMKSLGSFSAADLNQQIMGTMAPAVNTATNTAKTVNILERILGKMPGDRSADAQRGSQGSPLAKAPIIGERRLPLPELPAVKALVSGEWRLPLPELPAVKAPIIGERRLPLPELPAVKALISGERRLPLPELPAVKALVSGEWRLPLPELPAVKAPIIGEWRLPLPELPAVKSVVAQSIPRPAAAQVGNEVKPVREILEVVKDQRTILRKMTQHPHQLTIKYT